MSARLQRIAVLATVWASLELLERIAYRAGVTDAAAAADETLAGLADPRDGDDDLPPGDFPEDGLEDLADWAAFDASDVLAFHGYVTA